MAITAYPVALAKRTVVTLTSGTSYTVPAGVTNIVATLFGGGGGGGAGATIGATAVTGNQGHGGQVISTSITTTPGASIVYAIGAGGATGATGGTTSFTGATSATGGNAGNTGGNAGTAGSVGMSTGNGGNGGGSSSLSGGAGGAGKIEIEYWSY